MSDRTLLAALVFCSIATLTDCSMQGQSFARASSASSPYTALRHANATSSNPITLSFSANCETKCGGEADEAGYYEHFHGVDPRIDTITPHEAGYAGGFCIVKATPQGNAPIDNGDPGEVRNDGEIFTVIDTVPSARNASIDFIGNDAFPNAIGARDSEYADSVYAIQGAVPVNGRTGLETVLHISDAAGCESDATGRYARLTINWYRT